MVYWSPSGGGSSGGVLAQQRSCVEWSCGLRRTVMVGGALPVKRDQSTVSVASRRLNTPLLAYIRRTWLASWIVNWVSVEEEKSWGRASRPKDRGTVIPVAVWFAVEWSKFWDRFSSHRHRLPSVEITRWLSLRDRVWFLNGLLQPWKNRILFYEHISVAMAYGRSFRSSGHIPCMYVWTISRGLLQGCGRLLVTTTQLEVWRSGLQTHEYYCSRWWCLRQLCGCGCCKMMYTHTVDTRDTGRTSAGNQVRFYDKHLRLRQGRSDEFLRELGEAVERRARSGSINDSSSSSSSPRHSHHRGFEPTTPAPVQRLSTGQVNHSINRVVSNRRVDCCSVVKNLRQQSFQ